MFVIPRYYKGLDGLWVQHPVWTNLLSLVDSHPYTDLALGEIAEMARQYNGISRANDITFNTGEDMLAFVIRYG